MFWYDKVRPATMAGITSSEFHLPLEWLWTPKYHAGYLGQGGFIFGSPKYRAV